eukprot:19901-Heterococcus_DN1.PRE.7
MHLRQCAHIENKQQRVTTAAALWVTQSRATSIHCATSSSCSVLLDNTQENAYCNSCNILLTSIPPLRRWCDEQLRATQQHDYSETVMCVKQVRAVARSTPLLKQGVALANNLMPLLCSYSIFFCAAIVVSSHSISLPCNVATPSLGNSVYNCRRAVQKISSCVSSEAACLCRVNRDHTDKASL